MNLNRFAVFKGSAVGIERDLGNRSVVIELENRRAVGLNVDRRVLFLHEAERSVK